MGFHVPSGHSTVYEFFRFRMYNLCAGPRGYARLVGAVGILVLLAKMFEYDWERSVRC